MITPQPQEAVRLIIVPFMTDIFFLTGILIFQTVLSRIAPYQGMVKAFIPKTALSLAVTSITAVLMRWKEINITFLRIALTLEGGQV